MNRFWNFIRETFKNIFSTNYSLDLDTDEVITAKSLAGFIVSKENEDITRNKNSTVDEDIQIKRNSKNLEYESERVVGDLKNAGLAGGRSSIESAGDLNFASVQDFLEIPLEDDFDVFKMSEDFVRGVKPSKLLEILADASPELSRALFDFLLLCCPGWECKAVNPKTHEIDEKANDYLQESIIGKLKELYKAPEVLFIKHFLSAFLRGALASEVVLDTSGRKFVDIAIIDPESLTYKKYYHPERGLVHGIWQRQNGKLVDLNIPQVGYVPIHPMLGSNRGRSLAKPSIFVCFFLIATLQDLRRVIRQQGYPRIDITVNIQKLKELLPEAKRRDLKEIKNLAKETIAEVQAIYRKLKPDDTYIHSEVVEVNQPVGTLSTSSLGVIGELLKALERMATRALKTMPLLMATNEGVSEANANRQWEIHIAGIKSFQHYCEGILESHFNLALRAAGFLAETIFRFSELRDAEKLRDAQVQLLMTTIARMQYDNGSINADEMALKSAGNEKADVPEPRAESKQVNRLPTDNNPSPGGNRSLDELFMAYPVLPLMLSGYRATVTDISNAERLFKEYAPKEVSDLLNAEEFDDSKLQ